MKKELEKAYNPQEVEDGIYKLWEESGMFNPDRLPARQGQGVPYCIMMPPPNRTGTLHMGHAMGMAVQDLLIRFERMRGKKALWVPGTDHAAIATQVKVEQLLIKEGMKDPRKELGREEFLKRVVDFAEKSRNTIVSQTRKMGSSCDWSRERYTFDAERNRSVYQLFKMMHEDGLIERGYRIVNWDPQFQTTLSDDEVLTKDVKTKLLTFTYDKDFPIAISTTRPETKFGDTAVAVHPDDERYQKYIGKTFEPVFCGKKLSVTIVGDTAVDPKFGTGALGVTPAHSMIDAEIAERHGLKTVPVIGKDARMLAECGQEFVGLTVVETRVKVEKMLAAAELLQSVEEVPQALPVAERGGAAVEQLPMEQWFIRVNKKFVLRQDTLRDAPVSSLKKLLGRKSGWKKGESVTLKALMRYAVESGQTSIIPERFHKTYFHWIDNLRDWCISRQIWFGHRIPVFYQKQGMTNLQFSISNDRVASRPYVVADIAPTEGEWEQDADTLDTWFSAGAWTFSALGWPDEKAWQAHRMYHPTAVLETGYDILPFWVARMILMTAYAIGEVPFKNTYLHGLVRDDQGRKMSKSLGNIIDPVEMIAKYGADATRLSLLLGSTPGNDIKLSEEKIASFRNFTNKLWNISRYILMTVGESDASDIQPRTLADQWILSRLNALQKDCAEALERYQFSRAGEMLRDFTWNELADWYVEIAKIEGGKDGILLHILKTLLRLWHPFMPFVTECIWKEMGESEMLMVSEWPMMNAKEVSEENEKHFGAVRDLITAVRNARSEFQIPPKELLTLTIQSGTQDGLLTENAEVIKRLARLEHLSFGEKKEGSVAIVAGGVEAYLDMGGKIDVEKERARITGEMHNVEKYLKQMEDKMQNAEFMKNAPANIVEGEKKKYAEAQEKFERLDKQYRGLL